MTTERRTDARGKTTARVTFTDATSDTPSEGELHDIGRGGMFVTAKSRLPIGKRVDFEVHVQGSAAITGMARVIWLREAASGELPAGMGMKFIDVDNDALLAIDRLVGLKKNVRERTVLGIPAPAVLAKEAPKVEPPKPEPPKAEPPRPEAKVEAPKPALKSRERTVLGIAPPAQTREKELSWPDDVPDAPPEPVKKEASAPTLEIGEASMSMPVNFSEPGLELPKEEKKELELVKEPEPEPVKEPEPEPVVAKAVEPEPEPKKVTPQEASMPEPRELPKRESGGGGKWFVILLLIVGGAGAAYYFRDKIFPPPPTGPTPSATVSASASAMPSASFASSASASATVAEVIDAATNVAAEDASALAIGDAGIKDAGHDGGDAGKHHDAGAHVLQTPPPHPKPKPTATATSGDNPY